MDSLANYDSDEDNSNSSNDTKMASSAVDIPERRASDANYDPVQMDMSEESNNNNSSGDSGSERTVSSAQERQRSGTKTDSSRNRSSPGEQRRPDNDSHSSHSRDDHRRTERSERRRRSRDSNKSGRSSTHDDRRRRDSDHGKDSRDSRKSRDDEKRKDRNSSHSGRDERNDDKDRSDKDYHYRDDRRDRDRTDRDRDRNDRESRRERDRRHSRDDRTKDRHRDERSSRDRKEKDRTRSRSRSKDRAPAPTFRTISYREEKNRNKLAQLEKLGIALKAPGGDSVAPMIPGEPNYYHPLATATQGKYAEQIQKRKLLWANKSQANVGQPVATASAASTWMGTTFTHDQDGKVTAKFKRLMGIKGDTMAGPPPANKPDILKKQEEMFNNMEQQYEVARATTHTQRGVGLGYATGGYHFPR